MVIYVRGYLVKIMHEFFVFVLATWWCNTETNEKVVSLRPLKTLKMTETDMANCENERRSIEEIFDF